MTPSAIRLVVMPAGAPHFLIGFIPSRRRQCELHALATRQPILSLVPSESPVRLPWECE